MLVYSQRGSREGSTVCDPSSGTSKVVLPIRDVTPLGVSLSVVRRNPTARIVECTELNADTGSYPDQWSQGSLP